MQIRIGLTGNDLTSRTHKTVSFTSDGTLRVGSFENKSAPEATLTPGRTLVIGASAAGLSLSGLSSPLDGRPASIIITPANIHSTVCVTSLLRASAGGKRSPCYKGTFEVSAAGDQIRVVLVCELDAYLRGVLESEMPASYHGEAVKAQAVTARTYGLRPRIDHSAEEFNVCDSFLCCQNFVGNAHTIDARYASAIAATHNQILTYQNKPILALFSSCAGGHTESYENCFSDPLTQQFPPPAIPYLRGVPEGKLGLNLSNQSDLQNLWRRGKPETCDSWSPHFRWQVNFSDNALEAHMHHVVTTMLEDRQFAPFIKPPQSNQFGHIDRFEIEKRGVAGTAISLKIHTSTGYWRISKELVIRSVFKNPDLRLTRLKSARILFEHQRDKLGLLSKLVIHGFGWGHGVGLQQTGAQGLALSGKSYREILSHYFTGTKVQLI